jgi:hypothetical protein
MSHINLKDRHGAGMMIIYFSSTNFVFLVLFSVRKIEVNA